METYTEAIADVNAGGAAWRVAWPDETRYIALNGNQVDVYSATFANGEPYTPTAEDEGASDWQHTDRPPRP
jgi:hypothetical protein